MGQVHSRRIKKVRNLVSLIIVALVIVLVGCGGESRTSPVPTTGTKKMEPFSPSPSPTPVLVTPETIGLSPIKASFTAFPDCDGGECYDLNFTVGIKFSGEAKVKPLYFSFGGYSREKGTAKNQDEIAQGNKLYKSLGSVDPQKVLITMVGDEVTKISTIEELSGKTYMPAEVLWEKKKY